MSKKIFKNVILGKNVTLEDGVVIGLPPFGKKDGEIKTIIGDNAFIRANTVIYGGVKIGNNFQTGPGVLIRENNIIGNNVVVWHSATLNPNNKIGENCRIHAGCFLEMTTLGKNVFLGPNVTFTDDPHPIIPIDYRGCWGGAIVGDGAVIGGGATILPHVVIGKQAVVGAGSVVVENIPDKKIAVGNPAHVIYDVEDVICKRPGKVHFPYKRSLKFSLRSNFKGRKV